MSIQEFKKTIWNYYKKHKRDLPWRKTTDPYKILISEVMLQQTQVSRILMKYPEFLEKFPTFESLANSSLTDLLRVWKGIGYNRRALYLRSTAQIIVKKYNGKLPDDQKILETLPGIGSATAASIIVYTFNKPVIFIETNIRRVFIYFFFQDKVGVHDKELVPFIEKSLNKKNPREWYWALMDYGTMLAKTILNPNKRSKHYVVQSKFEGSNRQLRGKIIGYLLEHTAASSENLSSLADEKERIELIVKELMREGFIEKRGIIYTIK